MVHDDIIWHVKPTKHQDQENIVSAENIDSFKIRLEIYSLNMYTIIKSKLVVHTE